MVYRLDIPQWVERQIDDRIGYVVGILKNLSAAGAIPDDIELAYDHLKKRAEAYGYCTDPCLRAKNYRKISLSSHDYIFVYKVEGDIVYLLGFFHMLEDYRTRL